MSGCAGGVGSSYSGTVRAEVKFAAALVGAAALVVGAVIARDRLDDNGAPRVTPLDPGKAEVVVCLDELDTMCDALADGADGRVSLAIESGADTVERLSSRTPDEFTWVTTTEWIDVASESRAARALPALDWLAEPEPVAHAPLVLIVWADRAKILTNNCAAILLCAADIAASGWTAAGGQAAWGPVEFDLRNVDTSPASRAALGALAAQHFAAGDPPLQASDISSTDLDSPAFAKRFGALADAVPRQSFAQTDPFQRMLTVGPAALEMTVLSTVDLVERPIPAARSAQLVQQSIPRAAIDVAVVSPTSIGDSRALKWLRSDEGATTAERLGYRAGAADDELPGGGVLSALATRWSAQAR